jgi:hypothetical protein
MKKCSYCKQEKPTDEFNKDFTKSCGLQNYCKFCQKEIRDTKKYNITVTSEYRQIYYIKNKQILLEKQKTYKNNNKEVISKYQKEYRNNRRKHDVNFRLNEIIRSHVNRVFKTIGTNKEKNTFKVVDYSAKNLKEHLETHMKEGMSWDNYGDVWEIDHTIPISWFIKNQNIFNDINHLCKEVNSLSNLKPLFKYENRSKGDFYE